MISDWYLAQVLLQRARPIGNGQSEIGNAGEVQEWLNWQHWKCCERGTVPWVRIPPSPPVLQGKSKKEKVSVLTLLFTFLLVLPTNHEIKINSLSLGHVHRRAVSVECFEFCNFRTEAAAR